MDQFSRDFIVMKGAGRETASMNMTQWHMGLIHQSCKLMRMLSELGSDIIIRSVWNDHKLMCHPRVIQSSLDCGTRYIKISAVVIVLHTKYNYFQSFCECMEWVAKWLQISNGRQYNRKDYTAVYCSNHFSTFTRVPYYIIAHIIYVCI